MKFATVREMKARLSEIVAATRQGEVIVTKNGKPVALLSYLDEEEFEDYLLEHNPKFVRTITVRWSQYLKETKKRRHG